MRVSDFDFSLPNEQIARFPTEKRTDSRLLCLDGNTCAIEHNHFLDIERYLQPGDLLVMNNTRVIPARLFGYKISGGKIELLIERVLDAYHALVHLKASKSPKVGSTVFLEDGKVEALIVEREHSLFQIKMNQPVSEVLEKYGHMPLPPYMDRDDQSLDKLRYQTVYAKKDGAVAAPTAGLHFDEILLERLAKKGVKQAFVTLHVGSGTFQPVRVDTVEQHHMHSEFIEVSQELCTLVKETKAKGHRVVAVGTTSVRSLESAALTGDISSFTGETDIFIYPGYQFRIVDAMITNFHLPQSTLLMLVSAFSGRDAILSAYNQAVDLGYRFFSYGDAMWLTRKDTVGIDE